MKKAIVVISGGADSTTVLSMVKKEGYEIYAISFDYKQRNLFEIVNVKNVVADYDVKEHKIVEIDLRAFGGSALTDDVIDVPKYNKASDVGDAIPSTYVPARNTIFLSYALGYAETVGAHDIFLGVHATDHSNYPDCRPEYLKSFEDMANLATRDGVLGNRIKIHAPLIDKTKSEIIAIGLANKVDFSKTISCYGPTDKGESCGKCLACLIRLDAFEANGMADPIVYVD